MAQPALLTVDERPRDDPATMLSVEEARERVLAAVAPLDLTRVPLADALGRVLALDVVAGSNMPAFPNAAMDGFAVRAADTVDATGDRSIRLWVIDEAAAGRLPGRRVEPGTAIRIMTGAPVPEGADAVLRFEDTDELRAGDIGHGRPGGVIGVAKPATPGENIRPIGEDFRAGDRLLAAGTRLRPADIGLLATLDRTHAAVVRRPVVAVLATGDEVVEPGETLGPGQIRNSNSAMLAAFIQRCGGEPLLLGVARDAIAPLTAKLAAAQAADLILTTGGVSVGDYDLVKHVLRREGRIALWQVRIKPGKPLAFGWLGDRPLLGLPGNPVAAAVAFEQFARPAIGKMLGRRNLAPPTIAARLDGRIENRGGRRHYARVQVTWTDDGYRATLAGRQGAAMLSTLARADGLMVVPEDLPVAEPGAVLPVQMLDWDLP